MPPETVFDVCESFMFSRSEETDRASLDYLSVPLPGNFPIARLRCCSHVVVERLPFIDLLVRKDHS